MSNVIYLAGGINALTDEACMGWRKAVKTQLKDDTLDPMRRDYRGKEDECYAEIVVKDKYDIDLSDILLINATRPSWGTAMEVLYGYERNKINVSVVGNSIISPWLRYHSAYLVKTFDEAVRIINEDLHGQRFWKKI